MNPIIRRLYKVLLSTNDVVFFYSIEDITLASLIVAVHPVQIDAMDKQEEVEDGVLDLEVDEYFVSKFLGSSLSKISPMHIVSVSPLTSAELGIYLAYLRECEKNPTLAGEMLPEDEDFLEQERLRINAEDEDETFELVENGLPEKYEDGRMDSLENRYIHPTTSRKH